MSVSFNTLREEFFVIAGPCLVENETMLNTVASHLKQLSISYHVPVVLKGSFKKANRTSSKGFTTIGEELALGLLRDIGAAYQLPTLTDVHTFEDCSMAADFVDVLQIPAFLCRQTELIQAAANTGRIINIKKGQFVAPEDMYHAVEKAKATGNDQVMLCERGSSFGYHNLIVDMRGLIIMRKTGVPVVFDATHSVQLPSAANGISGGQPEFILPLARAACAVGVNGVFFETHPDPPNALSDAGSQLPLSASERMFEQCVGMHNTLKQLEAS